MHADPGNVGQVLDQVAQKAKKTDENLKSITPNADLVILSRLLEKQQQQQQQAQAAAETLSSKQAGTKQMEDYQAQLQKKVAATAVAAQQIAALNEKGQVNEVPATVPASFTKLTGTVKMVAAGFAMAQAAIFAVKAAIDAVVSSISGFLNVNSQMEQLRLQFEVMLGSKEKMEELFTITKKFADTTPFNDLDSYRAGQALLAAGVKEARTYERSLRTVGDLAAASGRSIGEVASAYARLKSGATGEAMEALRLMNISRAMFEAKGIRFDAGGQALATSEKLVSTLDSIVGDKYGGLTEKLS